MIAHIGWFLLIINIDYSITNGLVQPQASLSSCRQAAQEQAAYYGLGAACYNNQTRQMIPVVKPPEPHEHNSTGKNDIYP